MIVIYPPFDIPDYLERNEVIAEFLMAAAQDDKPECCLPPFPMSPTPRG